MEAPMKFVLEVDVPAADAAGELGRILRYWAGNLQHYSLTPGNGSAIHDSGYAEVGRWQVVGGRGAEEVEEAFEDFAAYTNSADDEPAAVSTDERAGEAEETAGYEGSEETAEFDQTWR
jgi:hypothetical protein